MQPVYGTASRLNYYFFTFKHTHTQTPNVNSIFSGDLRVVLDEQILPTRFHQLEVHTVKYSRVGNSQDKLRHTRSVAYSVELVLLNKRQISGGEI